MAKSIKNLKEVVDWNQCMGCGACYYYCKKGAITLENIEDLGIKPRIDIEKCGDCTECLKFCPGYSIDNGLFETQSVPTDYNLFIGKTLEVWEGYAASKELRFAASSGGMLSALSLFCLEKEGMDFVLHTGRDPNTPWKNKTIRSADYESLLKNTGSRYNASSPCEALDLIETTKNKAVFVGKPCDTAAVTALRKQKPALDKKLGLVLSFFCAGTPSTKSSKDLIEKLEVPLKSVKDLRYRGNGWPGLFTVTTDKDSKKTYTYDESWGYMTKFKPFRCNLCPDGLGEMADITCGDAWHRKDGKDIGRSLILVRTERGRELLRRAHEAGYVKLEPSSVENVIKAQGMTARRQELYGRLLAMRFMGRPCPHYPGFHLHKVWKKNSFFNKIRIFLGTIRRLIKRQYLKKKDPFIKE